MRIKPKPVFAVPLFEVNRCLIERSLFSSEKKSRPSSVVCFAEAIATIK
ncbi:MAG: hypothetical protein F6K17_41205 [Okeania sp. SIO3C4]|nr:hypothetical protein [Okeania sp. SIO3C4]